MTTDKHGFEERLRRIQEKRGMPPAPQGQSFEPAAPAAKPTRRSGGNTLMKMIFGMVAALGVLVLGLFGYVYIKVSSLPEQVMAQTSAAISNQPYSAPEPTAVDRLVSTLFSGGKDAKRNPVDFMPEPPEGWIRVTTRDVQSPDALTLITQNWPGDAPDALPIEQNLGYEYLTQYIERYRNPGLEARAMAKNSSRAIYMHPKGEFVEFRVDFLGSHQLLGEADKPKSWVKALIQDESKLLKTNQEIEEIKLGGIKAINRTNTFGTSLISRPIGTDMDLPNGLKIAAPLGHNVVVRVNGLTTPQSVADMLAGFDRSALDKLMEKRAKQAGLKNAASAVPAAHVDPSSL